MGPADALPAGLQLVGSRNADARLLSMAVAIAVAAIPGISKFMRPNRLIQVKHFHLNRRSL
jgi:Asp-tRNA(Asn)/Glu-tRNA(Gln) amidotransferase A subunit family amidase